MSPRPARLRLREAALHSAPFREPFLPRPPDDSRSALPILALACVLRGKRRARTPCPPPCRITMRHGGVASSLRSRLWRSRFLSTPCYERAISACMKKGMRPAGPCGCGFMPILSLPFRVSGLLLERKRSKQLLSARSGCGIPLIRRPRWDSRSAGRDAVHRPWPVPPCGRPGVRAPESPDRSRFCGRAWLPRGPSTCV